jgi:hypothetical protein
MQKESKNKQITGLRNKTEAELEEFHFSGGLEYEPLTVRARSREEAEEIWLKERKKVEPIQKIS